MKLALFNDNLLGVIRGEDVVDVSAVVADVPRVDPGDVMLNLIPRFDAYRAKLEAAAAKGAGAPVAGVKLLAPIPRPASIVCMAVNYDDGIFPPKDINAFHKSSGSVIGPDGTMILPDIAADVFEGEAELGLVIGKRASHVSEADALDHVFGYLNFIDGSARGFPVFFQVKSRATFSPLGPYLVTADEVADPQNLRVKSWTNGVPMQDFSTRDMANSVRRSISWLSSVHTLEPGTVVATGTHHAGLNPFQGGDVVEVEVEGLGRLRINVRDDLKRTWKRETRGELNGATTPQVSGKYAPGA